MEVIRYCKTNMQILKLFQFGQLINTLVGVLLTSKNTISRCMIFKTLQSKLF